MFKRNLIGLGLLALGLTAPAWAQQNPQDDPSTRARNEKKEIKKAYKDWIDKDVAYIITPEEKKAFFKLKTDEEREQFIEAFWRRRDPDPDTEENEYREEYYERIAYANERFASGIPGWKTDRGRIYITFGKPDSIESHPSGGQYDRPSYEGGGSTSTYPFEIWFYRYLEGVGSGIEIEFVDPTGTGEYRIARNANEKDALLFVPGAGLTLAEQLGLGDKADRITGVNNGNLNFQRAQDSPFERLQRLVDLQRPPSVKFKDLEADINKTGVAIDDNPLNFDMRVDFFRQSDERVITAFTVQTENKDLVFKDNGGIQSATMNIFGRITSVAGRRSGVFEDPVTTSATVTELTAAKDRKSAYQKAYALAPGTYKVEVIVRDVNSGATGVRKVGFTVPKYEPAKLGASTLVLAAVLRDIGDAPAVGQFVIGNYKVIPNVAGSFKKTDPVGMYLQIYNAGIDETTLRPSVDVDYVITQGNKEVLKVVEDWRGGSDAGQRLTLARLLPGGILKAGEYELTIRIRDRVSGQTLSPSSKFTVQD
jgi:GWxTD domain-containing protein